MKPTIRMFAGLLACSLAPSLLAEPGSHCAPSYRQLSSLEARSSDGWTSDAASVLLIGCRESLRRFTKAEQARTRAMLLEVIAAEGMGLSGKKDDPQFRNEIVSRINSALGGEAIGDVFFFGLGHADYGWEGE